MSTSSTVPVYEALAHDIKEAGIECVFGLMSDDTAMFVSTLDGMGVRFYGARHENNAITMAEGYAAATGKLGIAILGRGPATANALHGSVYTLRTGSPVLLVYGEASWGIKAPNDFGPDTKGFNATGVLNAAGLRTFVTTSADAARQTLATAMTAAHHGAVALLLPTNVQQSQVSYSTDSRPSVNSPQTKRQAARDVALQAAVQILSKSRKPLIIAGVGAYRSGAKEALMALADKLGAGLATTARGKDLFHGHPLDAGIVGSFSTAKGRRVIEQADCLIVFGGGLNQRTTSFGHALPSGIPLIHVDSVRENIGRWYPADLAIAADAKLCAEQLLNALPERDASDKPLHAPEFLKILASFDMANDFQAVHTPRTVDARSAALVLDALLPANRNVVYDSGNFLQILPYFSVQGPGHWKMANDFSSIGMGFGAAMGFARGTPDRPTVFFVGDGSFLMNLGELETVAREDIPLIIVVMNDCAYGAELHFLKLRDMPVAKSVFPDVDFAPIAEAFGFTTATVRSLDDLKALAPLLANPSGPILIDCKMTASVAAPFLSEGPGHGPQK